jgi:hypothetical protein
VTIPGGLALSSAPSANRGRLRWERGGGLVAALALTFLFVAAIGANEVRRDVRVLALLEPVVAWISRSGGGITALALAHQTTVGWASSAAATAIAVLGLIIGRWRGVPLLVLAAAVSLAVWGQIALLADRSVAGLCLYAAGFVCAALLGGWYPLTRLPGFPRWPLPAGRPAAAQRDAWPLWELVLLFGFTVLALLSRVYALSELPNTFDAEMTSSMLSSRTLDGLRVYLPWGLLGNSTGVAHLLPQMAFFHLFGTSVYALRLVAVLYGVTAVPLCYWLARRMAGTLPAVVATVLLIAAPEQLFWSRTEDTHFAPIAVAALVTAHLGLWLTERVSPVAIVAAALWMPCCRFFYAPAMILCAYPVALYAHAVVCVRGAWRKAWYAVPLLAGGVALWCFSLSIAYACLNHGEWRFVNPTGSYGPAVWAQPGQPTWSGLFQLRVQSAAVNVARVATSMALYTSFSPFYVRADASGHPTLINVAMLVIVVLALGYLLGQAFERRAFALLLWVGLGLLPALLSNDPADRRMSIIFPALYIVAGVFVGAIMRLVRGCAGHALERVTGALLALTLLGVVWTSLASHFLLPIGPLPAERAFRFTKPLFQESDVIFNSLNDTVALLQVFGNLQDFLVHVPCYRFVEPADWLTAVLELHCEFTDNAYRFTLPPERITALRAAPPRRQRISFLLDNQPLTPSRVELLRTLYPHARYSEFRSPDSIARLVETVQLVALTIDHTDMQIVHAPTLALGPGQSGAAELPSRLLAGIDLAPSGESAAEGIVVNGGLLIERPGWYRFAIVPPCTQATLAIDGRPTAERHPLLAGVHPFALTLPNTAACTLPMQLLVQSHLQSELTAIPAEKIVSPAVAALSAAQAPRVLPYDGYGDAREFVEPAGRIVDFGVDAEGAVFVFLDARDGYRVQRFNSAGTQDASWEPQGTQGNAVHTMVVAPDGHVYLRSDRTVWVFDRDGHPQSTWNEPPIGTRDLAILDDGHSLGRLRDEQAMAILDRNGRLQAQWDQFVGEPGRFGFPASVTRNPQGDVLIIERDGHALLFRGQAGQLQPQFVRRFPIAFSELPVQPQGVAFDGRDRILVPDPDHAATQVYTLDGQRLMARAPERDLNTRGFGNVVRYQATAERLYALDETRRLWVIAR